VAAVGVERPGRPVQWRGGGRPAEHPKRRGRGRGGFETNRGGGGAAPGTFSGTVTDVTIP
jgi:hypothetical protein